MLLVDCCITDELGGVVALVDFFDVEGERPDGVLGGSILIVANPMRTNTKKKANLNEKSVKFLFFLKRETANKSIAIMPIIKEKDAA